MKIAKVAITNVLIWYCTWTPYAMVVLIGQFGGKHLLTPLVSQVNYKLEQKCSNLTIKTNKIIYQQLNIVQNKFCSGSALPSPKK